MSRQNRFYHVVLFAAFPILGFAILLMIDLALHPFEPNFYYEEFWTRWLYGFFFALINIVIGVLCTRRARGNIIGPLLVIYGSGLTAQSLRASFDPLSGAFLFFIGGFCGWVGFFVLVLLFPNGNPHPRWMRWFLALLFLVVSIYSVLYNFGVIRFTFGADSAPSRIIENPLFVPVLGDLYRVFQNIMLGVIVPIFVLLPISVLLRFRASSSRERAQLRWILWGVLSMAVEVVIQRIVETLGFPELGNLLGAYSTILVFTLPAFAVGNAILRHRLYDIDIIIRRTLIYSILSAILGVVFFGGVTLTQAILRGATGQTSDVAIVISTLGIAALFTPLRRRIQAGIDRRFYRTKYDAQKTLEQFSAVMRDEVDAEKLKAALVSTIQETMQPKQIALWIREPEIK